MGASSSKQGSSSSSSAVAGLTDQERSALVALFETALGPVKNGLPSPPTDLAHLTAHKATVPTDALARSLPPQVPDRIKVTIAAFAAACSQPASAHDSKTASSAPPSTITLAGLADAACQLVFGSPAEKERFVRAYEAANAGAGFRELLTDVATAVAFSSAQPSAAYVPSERFVEMLINQCYSVKPSYGDDDAVDSVRTCPDFAAFETSFAENKKLQSLWKSHFQYALFARPPSNPPPAFLGGSSTLLAVEDIYTLHASLPSEFQTERSWQRLFTSDRDGGSWTVFADRITDAGAVLFAFRDTQGHIFGAFAASELVSAPHFAGDSRDFIFSLRPRLAVYRATGTNANYHYLSCGASTFTNGLGFGGQLDYFGLFLSASFDAGHSKAAPRSTTFGYPQLSAHEEFRLDFVEAWLVKAKEIDDRLVDPKAAKRSVLDDDRTAMLEMGGRRLYSKEVPPDVEKERQDAE
ncbi:hypothetical protein HDU87_005025 [Geranomyces variabilis]|uniref:MTOR-associated protein MEAK7 n=1 Tax=Geranomyces variabilis TaxID=109894 RepID=A0AAD5TQD2_9FUNG|nr:hypothetical protein HDU87_005025 [Geranomyces variabilis]